MSPLEKKNYDENFNKRFEKSDSLYGTKFHNSWRAIVFTIKGKIIGCEERWKKFKNFKEDMYSSYTEGYAINRIDKKKPFSKDNCIWTTRELLGAYKNVKVEYDGQIKSLKEWSLIYDLNYNGVMKRYYAKNYTVEEILFGKKRGKSKPKLNEETLTFQAKRDRASKMISTYKCRDKKRDFISDIDIDWFLKNITGTECFYCGGKVFLGCDRIDNSKGHTKDNVVACCMQCNTMRGDFFSTEEMKLIGQFIKENVLPKRIDKN